MIPEELRYTSDHEWVRIESDGSMVIGITDFAQSAMGDVVYLQLPETGLTANAGDAVAEVESIKSVAEVYLPVAGTVTAVNETLTTSPELVNSDPYGGGWLLRLEPAEGTDDSGLMDSAAYGAHTSTD